MRVKKQAKNGQKTSLFAVFPRKSTSFAPIFIARSRASLNREPAFIPLPRSQSTAHAIALHGCGDRRGEAEWPPIMVGTEECPLVHFCL